MRSAVLARARTPQPTPSVSSTGGRDLLASRAPACVPTRRRRRASSRAIGRIRLLQRRDRRRLSRCTAMPAHGRTQLRLPACSREDVEGATDTNRSCRGVDLIRPPGRPRPARRHHAHTPVIGNDVLQPADGHVMRLKCCFSSGRAGRIWPRSATKTTLASGASLFTKCRKRLRTSGVSIAFFHSHSLALDVPLHVGLELRPDAEGILADDLANVVDAALPGSRAHAGALQPVAGADVEHEEAVDVADERRVIELGREQVACLGFMPPFAADVEVPALLGRDDADVLAPAPRRIRACSPRPPS